MSPIFFAGAFVGLVLGLAWGYRLCRHYLYSITCNEAGMEMANRIFGKLPPPELFP